MRLAALHPVQDLVIRLVAQIRGVETALPSDVLLASLALTTIQIWVTLQELILAIFFEESLVTHRVTQGIQAMTILALLDVLHDRVWIGCLQGKDWFGLNALQA